MLITEEERIAISERISPLFDQVVGEYNVGKYPLKTTSVLKALSPHCAL